MNQIQEENAKPGTTDWQITKPAAANEIEGFASSVSVSQGQLIKFYIRGYQPKYSMTFYRMGWYDGKGARLIYSTAAQNTITQPEPEKDARNKVECFWKECFELTIPEDWCTGVYLCKLTTLPDQYERYIIFIVKPKTDKRSTYLLQIATNTYHAYNLWGGHSLYGSEEAFLTNYPQPLNYRARAISFNRPFAEGLGAGDFFKWEYPFIRWAEKNGLDIAYCTNHDLHENKELLTKAEAFLLPGHDEYWSKEMYDQVENALNNNEIGLGFFNANAMYWHSRFEDSFNGKNRTLVCYKCIRYIDFQEDPMYKTEPCMVTAQFRDSNIGRPEQKIIGQMYEGCFIGKEPNQDMVFQEPKHWLFEHTGIKAGDIFPGLIGYEYDRVWAEFSRPENLAVLNASPVKLKVASSLVQNTFSGITLHTSKNGNPVFSAGTSSWNWSLDNFGHEKENMVSEKLQKLTMNVLKLISKETKEKRGVTLSEVEGTDKDEQRKDTVSATSKTSAIFSELNNASDSNQSKPISSNKANTLKDSQQTGISRVAKAKLMPFFLIISGTVGFITSFMQFDQGFLGLAVGLLAGFIIGYLVDKKRAA